LTSPFAQPVAVQPHASADLDFYTWPTPNGRKVAIFLEEAEVAYNLIPVNTTKGDQFTSDYLAINPNNKIPTVVDFRGETPHRVFESGAILLHLADREGRFLPKDVIKRSECIQWLMWQMGGFGPMLGQAHHFNHYAPTKIPYAVERYSSEARRLYRVLDKRLADHEFVVGEYSIVDMAIWPWVPSRRLQGVSLEEFPNVARWNELMKKRPGVRRGFDVLSEVATKQKPTGSEWNLLFGKEQHQPR
jgi:GSH-dependent disulfide-bond oxidoreductase